MKLMKSLAGLLAAAAGCSAVAVPLLSEGVDDTAMPPPYADGQGIMQFPHVQVANQPASPASAAPQAASPAGGFMAYKDPVTGKLTAPTPDQAALLTSAARVQAPLARQATPGITRSPHGGISIMLDERHARLARERARDRAPRRG